MYSTRESNNFFLSLLENSTDLISIIDAEGYYRFVGGSVKHLMGYTPEEMIGLCAFNYIHTDDLEQAATALSVALQNKVTTLPYFRFRTKWGEWRWVECTITNMVDNEDIQGYVTNSRDVTERVKEEQRKKKSQAHYESLFDNHPDAVFELNKEGCFCKVNRRASEMTGYSEQQILQAHFRDIVYGSNLPLAMAAFDRALEGSPLHLELSILKQSGELATVGITVVPVLLENEVHSIQCIAKDITMLKRYDNFVKERADQLNTIMESVSASFYSLDSNWCFTYVNAYFTAYLGKSKAELIGRNIWELFPSILETRYYRECLKVQYTGTPSYFNDYSLYREEAILSLQIFPTGKGVSVYFVDVTEKQRERDLLEKLSLVASKTDNSVVITDAAGRTEWVNEGFTKLTGFTLQEVAGLEPTILLNGPETDEKALIKISESLIKGNHVNLELINYKKTGEKFWSSVDITPIQDRTGTITQFIAIQKDITYKKESEASLLEMTQNLFQQNKYLQQFSYMVSHNLRAPAANVMGLANILCSVDRNSRMFDETLSRIKISADTLDTVIHDMNHILSIRGSSSTDKKEVNLSAVCEEALSSVNSKLSGCQHTISVNIDQDLNLMTNKAYLLEILRGLFSNAVKFRKEDEVLKLDVHALQESNEVELVVQDNGIGMDMASVKNDIFKLYKKFHEGYEGRGVGLFSVKTYVEALGGNIKVFSEPAGGTSYRIKLKKNAT